MQSKDIIRIGKPKKPRLVSEAESGKLIHVYQMERNVICYGITEEELEHVSSLNTQATTFFSLSSALLVFSIGILADWAMEGQPSDIGILLAKCISPISGFLGLVFAFLAYHAVRTRRSIIKRIKEQSKMIGQ